MQQHFESCAWTTVSRAYDGEKLLGSMIQEVCKSPIVTIGEHDVIPVPNSTFKSILEKKKVLACL